jgi:RimJ/RimL family protein N-acetyltransferase
MNIKFEPCGFNFLISPDKNIIRQIRNEESVRMNLKNQNVITEEEHKEWILKAVADKIYLNVIKDDNKIIGFSQIENIDNDVCEVGFKITTEYQGKGLGKILVEGTLDRCFNELKMRKVLLNVSTENSRGIKLYLNSGFRICGLFRQCYFSEYHQRYIDEFWMELFKTEWEIII